MKIDWGEIIYNSGDFFLPVQLKKILEKHLYLSSNYVFYINGWTIVHFLSGVFVGFIYLYLKKPKNQYYYKMLVIHTIWELWQMLIGMSKPWKLSGNSSLIDIFVDTIFFMFGTYLTSLFYK
jgi:hypothetical protein